MVGLEWWDTYTNIKHRRYEYYHEATLENCINALASLYVMFSSFLFIAIDIEFFYYRYAASAVHHQF